MKLYLLFVTLVFHLSLTSSANPNPVQSFHPPPVTTIPAFPEQSDTSGCPLDLPNNLFRSIKHACTSNSKHSSSSSESRRYKCCPVLAAWLYSAYSSTALGKTIINQSQQTSYDHDLPMLPNDSETCIDNLENGLRTKGIELMRMNETCDVVYCECGIRLHPLSCPEAFSVNMAGDLVGNYRVKKLEKSCLNNGCSKCLKTLQMLNKVDNVTANKSEERTSKMQNEDCEQMGLTWLLAKNRSAYIDTVSAILRATMMSNDVNSIPESCTLNDGMPLAVDSSEINDSSSTSIFHPSPTLYLLSLYMLYVSIRQLFDSL
ncbi:uncharacterized GPI-anchored protein [Tanacetum coccineum]